MIIQIFYSLNARTSYGLSHDIGRNELSILESYGPALNGFPRNRNGQSSGLPVWNYAVACCDYLTAMTPRF